MVNTENFIDLRHFQPRFRQALIFSLFEGLRDSGVLTFVDENHPKEIIEQFKESNILNSQWKVQELDGAWAFRIKKGGGGCCGCCGGEP